MKHFFATLFLIALSEPVLAQMGRYSMLDRSLPEVRFLAEREGIDLSPEHDLGNGKVVVMYKKKKAQWEKVDLETTVSMYFDLTQNGVCYEIVDLIGVTQKWAADTVINRLKKKSFDEYRANLYHSENLNCAAKLQYIRPLDAKTNKQLPINMLQVVYWTLVKK